MSFRLKTILGIALIESVALTILIWSSLSSLKTSHEQELIRSSHTAAQLFASMTKDAALSYDLASLESFVEDVLQNRGLVYARVIGGGQVLAEGGDATLLSRPFQADAGMDAITDSVFDTSAELQESGRTIVRVELGFSTQEIEAVLANARQETLLIAALELFLSAMLSLLFGIYLTRNLLKLQEASGRIAAGDWNHRIPVSGKDEFQQTAVAFNKMTQELQQLQVQQKATEDDLRRAYDELRNAQSMLVQSAKLSAIGELASGIAHEIKTPLGAIRMNAELLKMTYSTNPQKFDPAPKLSSIEQMVDRCTAIINHIRNYSRRSENEPLNRHAINTILDNTLLMVGPQLRKDGVSLELELAPDLPEIRCNEIQLEQVFTNLINNARDAMEHRSEKVITLRTQSGENGVWVQVQDTGTGIPAEMQEKIFESFFTTKPAGKGTGLGLSITHALIKQHRGHISVESRNGGGTTFKVFLPLDPTRIESVEA